MTSSTSTQKKIIIIDDDQDLLKILTSAFTTQGYEVKSLLTGNKGLEYILTPANLKNVRLIVLDRILPDMDGLDILKKFNEKNGNNIPVLILSVLSSDKDILEGLKEGAVDYIAKPFSLPIFMEKALTLIDR